MKSVYKVNKFNFSKNLFLASALFLISLIFCVTNAEALTIYKYFNRSDPASAAELQDLIDNGPCQLPDDGQCPGAPLECFNSASVGVTDCGTACQGGSAWSRYSYLDCYQTKDPLICTAAYDYSSAVYSTADKCSNGSNNPPPEPYLRPGFCDGRIGRDFYKTCCTNTTPSYVSSNSCVAIQPFSGAPYPPYDGVCPAGSDWIICGVNEAECTSQRARGNPCTTAACGQSACGPIVTCSNGTAFNQCGKTGDGTTTYSCQTLVIG